MVDQSKMWPKIRTIFGLGLLARALGVLSFLLLVSPAFAAPNSLLVSPTSYVGGPGSSVDVALIADPPVDTLSAWVLELRFNPDVVRTTAQQCDSVNTPPGAIAAVGCNVDDTDEDGVIDTVKTFGSIVFRDGGAGFADEVILADITFDLVGSGGECTQLEIRSISFVSAEAEETDPSIVDGEVCVESVSVSRTPAPTSETTSVTPSVSTTSGPVGADDTTSAPGMPSGDDSGVPSSPAGTGGTAVESGGLVEPTETLGDDPTLSDGTRSEGGDDGSSDTSVVLIAALAALGLAVVGSGVLIVARIRGGDSAPPPTE